MTLPGMPAAHYDAVVIGAGFAGLYMLHRLRKLGMTVRVFERGDGVGGTWYWNRYPGARCDTESVTYSFSFSDELQQEWEWTERYAPQAEILAYANHVAERFDLKRDIEFETSITSAHYDEAGARWLVTDERGSTVSARFLVSAVGCLSAAALPDYPGLEDFRGEWYHTGRWPHEPVSFTGKRVGIVGTGSSGVQSTIAIAPQAKHLTVFQRTPNYSIPAWNGPLDPAATRKLKENYAEWRARSRYAQIGIPFDSNGKAAKSVPPAQREREYEAAWAEGGFNFVMAYPDILTDLESNRTAADFVERKIREKVKDPKIAELLIPTDHPLGTKRLCVDTGYYETFNRDNVTLVDLRSAPIERITPTGLRTANADYALDTIVFATGFDAITGPLMKLDIRGRGGIALREKWADGGQPERALQHADVDRAARRLHDRLHRDDAAARHRLDRAERGGRGALGTHGPRGRSHDALSARAVLVHGREHPRQAAAVHALCRRRRHLSSRLRGGRREGLRGLRAAARVSEPGRRWIGPS
ncbi:MAG: flavin-containing monooxygenase [Gammaproteobacteria bacterium]